MLLRGPLGLLHLALLGRAPLQRQVSALMLVTNTHLVRLIVLLPLTEVLRTRSATIQLLLLFVLFLNQILGDLHDDLFSALGRDLVNALQ